MKKIMVLVLVAVMFAVLAQCVFAADVTSERTVKQSGKAGVVSVVTTTEKIEVVAVDPAKRTIRLKTSDGDVADYDVSTEVRNLAQVKKGDVLTAKEVERVNIYAVKSSGQGKDRPAIKESYTFTRAPKGAKPGFVAIDKMKLTGRVQLVSYNERKLTVTGPAGKTRSFEIARDVKNLKNVKPGDVVVVDYTDTYSIAVATPKK